MNNSTSLNTIGESVRQWQDEQFPDTDMLLQTLVLAEETGEVCRAVVKEHQGVRPKSRGILSEELADVILLTAGLADRAGVDLNLAVKKRLYRLNLLDFKSDEEASQTIKR